MRAGTILIPRWVCFTRSRWGRPSRMRATSVRKARAARWATTACQGRNYGTLKLDGGPGASSVGMFGRYNDTRRFAQVTDGLSKTIMVGETLPASVRVRWRVRAKLLLGEYVDSLEYVRDLSQAAWGVTIADVGLRANIPVARICLWPTPASILFRRA